MQVEKELEELSLHSQGFQISQESLPFHEISKRNINIKKNVDSLLIIILVS